MKPSETPAARPPGRGHALGAGLLLLVALALAALLGLLIRALPAVGQLDLALVLAANRSLTAGTAGLALGIDALFGPLVAGALVMLAALAAGLLCGSRWAGIRAALLVAVPWGLAEAVKLAVRRPRPDGDLLLHQLVPQPLSFGYPSGHTACAAAFCVALLIALPAGRPRRLALVPAALLVLATAWSRVALGVHHPTDVLVSLLLVPTLCVLLARLLDRLRPPKEPVA